MNELNNKIEEIFKQFYDAGADSVLIDWKRNDIQKLNKEATQAIQDLLAEQVRLGRIDELKLQFGKGLIDGNYLKARIKQLKDTTKEDK